MKIHGTPMMTPVERFQGSASRPLVESEERASAADEVRVAGSARFAAEIRASASTLSEIRAAEVVRAREDVETGVLLTDAEIEAAVDGLLAGL